MSKLENLLLNQKVLSLRDPFRGLLAMEVTQDITKNITEAKLAYAPFIPEGHLIAIVAKANGGKTTIMTYIAGQLAKTGYRVIYVNADAGASDIKQYEQHAREHGYHLISPDYTLGSAEMVVEELQRIANAKENLSDNIIVLDTLKKFSSMMCKTKAAAFFSLLRTLTSRGITILCLAHTNKYDDKEGNPIYEGTGDLRNDVDELIYLMPTTNPDGSLTVSTKIDKSRADISNASFRITAEREVFPLPNYVDTEELARYERRLADDQPVIAFVLEHIKTPKTVTEMHAVAKQKGAGFSRARIDGVLRRYSKSPAAKWTVSPASTIGLKYGPIDPKLLGG